MNNVSDVLIKDKIRNNNMNNNMNTPEMGNNKHIYEPKHQNTVRNHKDELFNKSFKDSDMNLQQDNIIKFQEANESHHSLHKSLKHVS